MVFKSRGAVTALKSANARADYFWEAALLILSALAVASWLWKPIGHANDIWWHLATGRYIAENHVLPLTDVFSSTAAGHRWINHEWLYQLVVYFFYRHGGIRGVIWVKILLVLGALGQVEIGLRNQGQPLLRRWLILVVVFWASHFAWRERADLVSIFFIAALANTLTSLAAPSQGHLPRRSWLWPGIFALWSNMHGGFILGLAFIGTFTAGLMMERRQWLGELSLWLAACCLATFVNPWGYQLHRSLLEGASRLQTGIIQEWTSTPWQPLRLFWICLVAHWVVIAIQCWRTSRTIAWSQVLPDALLSWSAVQFVRNVPYFMLAAFPAAAEQLPWSPRAGQAIRFRGSWKPTLCGAAILCTGIFTLHAIRGARSGIDPQTQPVEACAFIQRTDMPGHFYNDYEFGGYWIWVFGARRPVFIDGRFHTVEGYVELYRQIEDARSGPPEEWEHFLQRHHVDAALVANPKSHTIPAIFWMYFPRRRWALVYADDVALIFIRRTAGSKLWIRRYELPAIDSEAKPLRAGTTHKPR